MGVFELEPGTSIGGFRLEEVIGRGGMGVVYLAEQVRLRRTVALKVLAPELTDDDEFRRRFQRESEIAASLDHPNVIPVFDAGEADGLLYLAMRYVDGEDLASVLSWEGPLGVERTLDALRPVADALDTAHAAGLVHRDVKPANILLAPGGHVYLTDFGVAKVRDVSTSLTLTGQMIGTLAYAAPEQIRGEPLDGRTDQYALACTAHQCLTGEAPFVRHSDVALLYAHLDQPPPRVSEARPELQPFDPPLARALDKEPRRRFESCAAFVSALDAAAATSGAGDSTILRAAVPAPPPGLPVPATPFVGRERERAEAGELVRSNRLVTLLGPGGSGKTRLALQVAADSAPEFRGGVCWVGLDTVDSAELVPAAVAHALGIREGAERPVGEAVLEHLRARELLLVLDNVEHVIEAAAWVAEALRAAPSLAVLATSRERLRIEAERTYEVGALLEADAVELFTGRARAADPGFEPDDAVREICARLDGLPLAIELAAARASVFSPSVLRDQLERSLPVLTGGARDRPERQRTLRGAIEWSFRLLDERERRLFVRLGVFRGGWTFDAAQDVCDAELDTVASLLEKSLIRRDGDRFLMLATIREYALEQLEHAAGADELRSRYAGWYLELAERAEPELTGADQEAWLQRLENEHANLRAVLEWARATAAVELELRVAGALSRFWSIRGYLTEGRSWLEDALARGSAHPKALRAKACAGASLLAQSQGDYDRVRELAQQGLELYEAIGDARGVSRCLNDLGFVALCAGEHDEAATRYERAADVARAGGETRALAVSIGNLADLALNVGDYERAETLAEEAIALQRRVGDKHGIAIGLMNRGIAALHLGRLGDALAFLDESLTVARQVGDEEDVCFILEALAGVFAARGAHEQAVRLLAATTAALSELGAAHEPAEAALYESTLGAARAALEEDVFEAAWEAGGRLDLDQAVEDARQLALDG